MKIYNLRFYISMDYYFTFTTYPGMDPDAASAGNTIGIDKGLYPAPRKLIFGLSFGF